MNGVINSNPQVEIRVQIASGGLRCSGPPHLSAALGATIDGSHNGNTRQSVGASLCVGCHASSALWQTTSSMKPWGSRK